MTSWQVKKKYNTKAYCRVVASLPKDIVERFKTKCKADGVSIASVVKAAIIKYLESAD